MTDAPEPSEDRFARHRLIDWFDQESVRNERIAVVGTGAAGNEVVKNLALLGVGELHLFDFDTVEEHNLTRSVLLRDADVGRPKVECVAARAAELAPGTRVEAYHGDVWHRLSFDLLDRLTAVISCVDSYETRLRLNRLCRLLGTDFVNTGLDSRFASVELYPFSASSDCACFECGLPEAIYARIAARYSCGWLRRIGLEEAKIPTTIVTSSLAGAGAASLLLHRRRAQREEAPGAARWFFDSGTGAASGVRLARQRGCNGCGDLTGPVEWFRAGAAIAADTPAGAAGLPGDLEVLASDRILVAYRCATEGCENEGTVFELADRFDEGFAVCPDCRLHSRQLEIRRAFSLDELRTRFAGRRLPGKFVTFTIHGVHHVAELGGIEHEP